MKLGMFTEPKAYIEALEQRVEGRRNFGLPQAREMYEFAQTEDGFKYFISMNPTMKEADREEAYERWIAWNGDHITHIEKEIRKWEREIRKTREQYGL